MLAPQSRHRTPDKSGFKPTQVNWAGAAQNGQQRIEQGPFVMSPVFEFML
jgi:hypothetical protein